MAAHSSRVQFADQGIQYNIALAQGIPVMGLMLTDGKDVIGPLQVGSFVADSLWYAAVKPIFVRTGTEQVQIAAQCRIFAELVPVIGSLQARIVTL